MMQVLLASWPPTPRKGHKLPSLISFVVEKLWGTCVLLAPAADQSGNRARRPSRHHLLLWSRQPWSHRRQPSSVASKLIQDKGEGPDQPADVSAAATGIALGAQG